MQRCQEWAEKLIDQTRSFSPMHEAAFNSRSIPFGALTICFAIWLLFRAIKFLKEPVISRPATPDLEKPASRSFKAPARKPGELDKHYLKFHADKAKRILDRGPKCSRTDPSAFDGAVELLEELCGYLPERYPSLFKRTLVGMDNLLTGESFNIVERPLVEDPMQMAGRMVQDDLAIMFEREDGQYYLLAGSILLAGFWRLEDKFGMPLSEIHTSGDVPGFKEKLEKGMMNFFRRVQPNGPVQRNNYFIQVDDELSWSSSIGPEDGEPGSVGWFTAEKNKAISHHYFRSERQTLRRLPRSGGVVFTIRTYFHPITEICEESYVPGRLASAVRSWGDDVSRYKGKERYEEVLLEYLDTKHREQVEAGLDFEKEDEVRAYPF
ncbi:hypothetical protein OIDMADRAFT_107520 [Oidiodendron maius Zn]|uniref:Mannosyl transferase n=1 Tax=Oidiodendron maius (strain Zn) TaxID=913774 RepID=A0A0C3E274_OIDMZ|nr:hypothetical protein OIDMADRAFT_107520 [Oidiodendron maius Zn]